VTNVSIVSDMTLEIVLWAIPVGCLAAASALIGARAWRLTRDSVIGKAILVGAESLAAELPDDEPGLRIAVSVAERAACAKEAPAPSPILANPRLCPVPIVVCSAGRPAA
jgi:hypothetical protein